MRYQLDDLVIDTGREQVWRGDERLDVRGLSFRLLVFMLERGNTVVGFDELMEAVWAPSIVNEETVTQRVRLLRAALGDEGRQPRYLRSVRGRGYQLCEKPEMLPDGAAPTRSRHAVIAAAMIFLLLLPVVVYFGISEDASAPIDVTDPRLERADYYASIGQADDNDLAIALYQQVLTDSPDDVRARLGLSVAYSARVCRFDQSLRWAEDAESLARDVLAETPDDYRAHQALAYSLDCRGHVEAAIDAYSRAVALNPGAASGARSSLAYLLGERGRLADALMLNLAVRESDPAQTYSSLQIARVHELLGYVAEAEALYRESFDLYPDNLFSNAAYPRHLFRHGRFREARHAMDIAMERPSHPDLFVLAGELALLEGDATAAQAAFHQAREQRPSDGMLRTLANINDPVRVVDEWADSRLAEIAALRDAGAVSQDLFIETALIHQARGKTDAAVAALDVAVDAGFRDRAWLQISPLFNDMRTRPEYAAVIDRISTAVLEQRELVPPARRPAAPR